ncbi:37s ribosomal protein s9 [Alternaria alternata]|nr:37s ribosomal protein s9 [Alternaria alternata]
MVAVIQSSWSRLTRQPSLARPAATPTSQVPTIVFSSSFNTPVQAFTVCSPAWLVNYFLFASHTARCSPNVAFLHHFPPTSPPALIQPGCHRIADHTTPTCTLLIHTTHTFSPTLPHREDQSRTSEHCIAVIFLQLKRGYPGGRPRLLRELLFLHHWAPLAARRRVRAVFISKPSGPWSISSSNFGRHTSTTIGPHQPSTLSGLSTHPANRRISYAPLHQSAHTSTTLAPSLLHLLRRPSITYIPQACKLANYATPPVSPLGYRALEPPFSLQYKGGLVGMDNDRRPRHTPSGYASQQGTLLPPQASYPVVSAPDRFRQPPLTAPAPPTSVPSSGSRASSQGYGYAYGEGAQFGSSIQASPVAYATQDYAAEQQQQAQRAPQQYSPYGQNIMYSVPGAQASAQASSQYEPVEQYQQNRDSAIQVLSTGFGVAQSQYYESGPTSAPASAIAAQNVPSQYPSLGYSAPQAQVGREALAPAYSAAGMTDPHQAPSQGAYSQGNYSEPQPNSGNEYDDFYRNYQNELKKTFEHEKMIRRGRLGYFMGYMMTHGLMRWNTIDRAETNACGYTGSPLRPRSFR